MVWLISFYVYTCTLGSPWYLHAIFICGSLPEELGAWLAGVAVEDDNAEDEAVVETDDDDGGNRVLCVSSTQAGRSYRILWEWKKSLNVYHKLP